MGEQPRNSSLLLFEQKKSSLVLNSSKRGIKTRWGALMAALCCWKMTCVYNHFLGRGKEVCKSATLKGMAMLWTDGKVMKPTTMLWSPSPPVSCFGVPLCYLYVTYCYDAFNKQCHACFARLIWLTCHKTWSIAQTRYLELQTRAHSFALICFCDFCLSGSPDLHTVELKLPLWRGRSTCSTPSNWIM